MYLVRTILNFFVKPNSFQFAGISGSCTASVFLPTIAGIFFKTAATGFCSPLGLAITGGGGGGASIGGGGGGGGAGVELNLLASENTGFFWVAARIGGGAGADVCTGGGGGGGGADDICFLVLLDRLRTQNPLKIHDLFL